MHLLVDYILFSLFNLIRVLLHILISAYGIIKKLEIEHVYIYRHNPSVVAAIYNSVEKPLSMILNLQSYMLFSKYIGLPLDTEWAVLWSSMFIHPLDTEWAVLCCSPHKCSPLILNGQSYGVLHVSTLP